MFPCGFFCPVFTVAPEKKWCFGNFFFHSMIFMCRFSWSIFDKGNLFVGMYICNGKNLFSCGGKLSSENISFFTNNLITLSISLTLLIPSPTYWCIFFIIRSSTCCDIPPYWKKNIYVFAVIWDVGKHMTAIRKPHELFGSLVLHLNTFLRINSEYARPERLFIKFFRCYNFW